MKNHVYLYQHQAMEHMMAQQNIRKKTDITTPELWDFPMDYPISIIGEATPQLLIDVTLILKEHVPDFDANGIQIKASKTGKYHSLKARLYLTNADQVNALYAALAEAKTIKTVL